jgi:hypothetical protein
VDWYGFRPDSSSLIPTFYFSQDTTPTESSITKNSQGHGEFLPCTGQQLQATSRMPSSGIMPRQTWTTEDERVIKSIIDTAMIRAGGDVVLAFEYTRNLRQQKANYFDMNLAIAADYLRARWETLKYGSLVANLEIELYMRPKQLGFTNREGPGPVSPYSETEYKWMRRGVTDQTLQGDDEEIGVYWNRLRIIQPVR